MSCISYLLKENFPVSHPLEKNFNGTPNQVNYDDSTSGEDLAHKNDILQKALERMGLPLSDNGTENSS